MGSIQIDSLPVWHNSTVNSIRHTRSARETAARCVNSPLIWRLPLAMNWIGNPQVVRKAHATRSISPATRLPNFESTIRSSGSSEEI